VGGSIFEKARIQRLRKNDVLYQGTTLVVLNEVKKVRGFSP
jgi:hypothetical protein